MNAHAPTGGDRGAILLALAREAIARALEIGDDPPSGADPDADWLRERRAAFVTLTVDGRLRGCIGTVEAYRPLLDDVRANAVAAAFRDPRFPPLERHEFERVRVGVSVLSEPEPIAVADEADAARSLVPRRDGVLLEYRGLRGIFLPQVWAQLPDPAGFLRALKAKAGLPEDFWSPEVRLFRYRVEKYEEGAGVESRETGQGAQTDEREVA
jgi:AmmeMemoRadiSam system protein A